MPETKLIASRFRTAALSLTALFFGLTSSISSFAQNGGAITFVVPYGPGGPSDLVARVLATQVEPILKQTIIVVNKPGAGSAIGARNVAAAAPDGNTILIGNVSTFTIIPAIMKKPGYDPLKSLAPIAKVSDSGIVLLATASFAPNSMKELVAYAKANPDKVFFSSAGTGNSAHLMGELLKTKAGVDIVHVPYKGGSEALAALRGGQVQIFFSDVSIALGMIKEKQVKALAVTSRSRLPLLPDVPTMVELGYPDMVLSNWVGAAAPAGTDPKVLNRLESAINEAIKTREFQAFVEKAGGDAKPGNSREFAALIASEYKRWREIAEKAGVSLD